MKKPIFEGAGVAIVTPMKDDGSVNFDVLGELIEFQIVNGTDAIVICGTTGESSTLTHEEHIRCIRYAVEKTSGRVPVIAGTGSNDTAYCVSLSKEAEEAGVDGLLIVTPYYNKTTQVGLIRHYTYIADRVTKPIIVYHIPSRTGLCIQPETFAELAKHPNIVAAKEASGNISAIARTIALCGGELSIYSGNDDQVVPIMALGGQGVISTISNIMPAEMHGLCRKFMDGDLEGAREDQLRLLPLIAALFCEVNPIPVKHALNLMGKKAGPCRMPLCPMAEKDALRLQTEMEKAGLL